MKDRRKRPALLPWKIIFLCLLALVFVSGFTFSTFQLFFTGYNPKLVSSWRKSAAEAISVEESSASISIGETVSFPDQVLILLKYPPSTPLLTKDDIVCAYFSPNTSGTPLHKTSPLSVGGEYLNQQIVRCHVPPRNATTSVSLKHHGYLPPGPTHDWKRLAYGAIIDGDNTTVVFAKGLNLRPGKPYNASRFQCVYGWDFTNRKFLLRSQVVSAAQEIVRCKTPLTVLNGLQRVNSNPIKVSVRVIGSKELDSIARVELRASPDPKGAKEHRMCICTMLRNQARFLREWVMYHSRIGVERWFIYDNNSDDGIENVIEWLVGQSFKITRHMWPWIKTQEAGFAHCALRARDSCEWVGFIDIDEFFYLPSGISLGNILDNQSRTPEVAEIRTSCHNFGPSGHVDVPRQGVTMGYTCRLSLPERHKSIIRPEELNSTLTNVVHHFDLKNGSKYVHLDRDVMVINHYKYQVWQVFKEKFYRRVATYVSDWQEMENVGSKDRVPGLGTRAVEPVNWSTRFCEVTDTGLRDWVIEKFSDPKIGMLPWEEDETKGNFVTFVEDNLVYKL